MEPLPRRASAADSPRQRVGPESPPLPKAQYVAVVFKECRYDDGGHKTWFFSNMHHVDVVQRRSHLIRAGHGLVFEAPYEEIEPVYRADQDTS